jgi:hypothetical protein
MKGSGTNSKKKKVLKHIGKVGMAIFYLAVMTSPMAFAAIDSSEAVEQVLGSEGAAEAAKAAMNSALKAANSKPAMTGATVIVCLACVPLAGAAASPGMCIACGILIAKTLG